MKMIKKIKIKNLKASCKNYFSNIKFCISVSMKSSRKLFLSRVFIEAISSVIPFVTIIIGKEIINYLIQVLNNNQSQNIKESSKIILSYIVVLGVLKIIGRVLGKINESFGGLHKDLIGKYIDLEIANKSVSLDLSYFDSAKFYNELTNARRDSKVIETYTWYTINMLRSIIQLIIASVVLAKLHILFVFALLITGIPSVLIEKKFTGKLYNWQLKRVKEERKMQYIKNILSSRQYAKDIRLFNLKPEFLNKYKSIWKLWFNSKKDVIVKKTIQISLISIIPELGVSIIMVFVVLNILNGRLTIGDYSLYIGIVGQMTSSIFLLVNQFSRIYDNELRFKRYKNFTNWESKLDAKGKLKPEGKLTIRFEDVSFKYPGTDDYILKNLNLEICSNEKIALVGVNGAGKSTIVKLILRFYDPTEGTIYINDIDIKKYDINDLRKCFSVLFQDYANYSFTIRDNIGISNLEHRNNEEKLMGACKKSEAIKIVNKYSTGLNTYLTREYEEDGKELSGGEWQKIAIARTFFRDGQVLILDEPSASLDPEAEDRIFSVFDELCDGKGAIFISHRLSNVINTDRIIVVEDGKVVEEGTHSDLLKKSGKYAYLFNLQAKKYRKVL